MRLETNLLLEPKWQKDRLLPSSTFLIDSAWRKKVSFFVLLCGCEMLLSHKEETSKKVSQKGVPLILKLIGKANSLTGKKWKNNDVIYYRITQCLKITEKVSFNIASEASYVTNIMAYTVTYVYPISKLLMH